MALFLGIENWRNRERIERYEKQLGIVRVDSLDKIPGRMKREGE